MARKLINALERPVHVLINDEVVELPMVPSPTIHSDFRSEKLSKETEIFIHMEGSFTLDVLESIPSFTINLPDPDPDVLLLVDLEVLLQLPDRSDLVAPAYYTMLEKSLRSEEAHSYLSGVYSSASAAAMPLPDLRFEPPALEDSDLEADDR